MFQSGLLEVDEMLLLMSRQQDAIGKIQTGFGPMKDI